jgi:hypothetical protein
LCLMQGFPVSLVAIVWWSSSIRVDVVHRHGVVMLVFTVMRFWGFVWL